MKILIVGGEQETGINNKMIVLKGDRWIKLPLKLPREFAAGGAVYLHGEIYIFGGSLGKETYKLDSTRSKWSRLADMNEKHNYIANSSLAWNGGIWVFGGWLSKCIERYDPVENKWTRIL